jgi:hypothetical protein
MKRIGGKVPCIFFAAACALALCATTPDAQATTADPWVPGPAVPANATIGGKDASGRDLYVCRSDMGDGIHPGELSGVNCIVGWGGTERAMPDFEVLAMGTAVSWVSASQGFPARAIIGGTHASGPAMAVCRADMGDGLHPGKVWNNRCHVGWGGTERVMPTFEVLVPVADADGIVQLDVPITITPSITITMPEPQPSSYPATPPIDLEVRGQFELMGLTPVAKSGPVCGGIVNGVAQPRCAPKKADYISKSRNECASGSFFDLTTWSCWSCPAGFVRSAAPVISEQACSRSSSQALKQESARFIGPRCPQGSFFDPIHGGECYQCPAGYNRSAAHIGASNACYVPITEQFSRASRHNNTIWPHECSSGRFHDLWNGGACWSCPSGYRRTAYHVNNGNACARTVPEQHARAAFVRKAACEPGTFFDPRNGGECWQCPEGALRTVFPVYGSTACERPAGVTYQSAQKIAPLTCEPGDHFDLIDGGTCWRCPSGYNRSATSVKSADACTTDTMQWQTASYREPGLFQLDGAREVLLAIARHNPALVKSALDTVAEKLSKQTGAPLAQVRVEQQQAFIEQPHLSLVAHAVVYTRLIAAIAEPARASDIEGRLVTSFRQHVVNKRTYIAEDMLSAYSAWKASDDYWRAQRNLNRGLAGLVNYGTVPPSFDKLGMAATTGIGATATATGIAIEKTFEALMFAKAAQRLPILGDVLGAALSMTAAGVGWTPATSTEVIALQATRTTAETALSVAISQLLSFAAQVPAWTIVSGSVVTSVPVAALSTTGPQIIVAAGLILTSMAIDQFIEIEQAETKLKHAVITAKADPELGRMAKTKEGLMQMQTFWSYAMEGMASPPDAAFLKTWGPVAQASVE